MRMPELPGAAEAPTAIKLVTVLSTAMAKSSLCMRNKDRI
jgi:hypothetical protein